MDELDLLKKDWQKDNVKYPELSYDDIYKMSHAKSSSIVKWIFIISILEFVFWLFVAITFKALGIGNSDSIKSLDSNTFFIILSVLGYVILAYFFYRFYRNYKNISSTDSTRRLMKNILRTRKTVKHYVIANLAYLVVGTVYGIIYFSAHDESTKAIIDNAAANGDLLKFYAGVIVSTVIALAVVIALLLAFYWLIYGILLKRLNRNYRELKKLEV